MPDHGVDTDEHSVGVGLVEAVVVDQPKVLKERGVLVERDGEDSAGVATTGLDPICVFYISVELTGHFFNFLLSSLLILELLHVGPVLLEALLNNFRVFLLGDVLVEDTGFKRPDRPLLLWHVGKRITIWARCAVLDSDLVILAYERIHIAQLLSLVVFLKVCCPL